MLVSKTLVVFFLFLCFVHSCISKPTTGNELTEGRGVMTSIWGWITYPFSWWSSGETEQPVTEQLLGSTPSYPGDIIDIRSHNVTIWCNDQTCTTMKCDKFECRNITCNIYDTDFRGECREYIIVTEAGEFTIPLTTETVPLVSISNEPTEVNETPIAVNSTQEVDNTSMHDEHPLELEAVLSSTVNKLNVENNTESKDPTKNKTKV